MVSPENKRLITFRNNRHLADDVMTFAAPVVAARKLRILSRIIADAVSPCRARAEWPRCNRNSEQDEPGH